jgi:hypothetical protein
VLRLEHANYWRVIARLAEGKSGAEPDV